jgi:hypothetical protein
MFLLPISEHCPVKLHESLLDAETRTVSAIKYTACYRLVFCLPVLYTIVIIQFSCHFHILLFCLSRLVCQRFLFFLSVGKFFKQFLYVRWLCKLFDKALVEVMAREALTMCLQNKLTFHFSMLINFSNCNSGKIIFTSCGLSSACQ